MEPNANWLTFAWAGWQVRTPPDWRPLKFFGGWREGSVLLGDGEDPLMELRWQRPRHWPVIGFNAAKWVRKRVNAVAGPAMAGNGRPPAGMAVHGWQRPGSHGKKRQALAGYGKESNLAMEIVFRAVDDTRRRRICTDEVLPTLELTPASQPVRWAILGVGFVTPAGFEYEGRQLNLGDMSLRLTRGRRSALTVRQVYPGGLALSRKDINHWLHKQMLSAGLRHRKRGQLEEIQLSCLGEDRQRHPMKGYVQRGIVRPVLPTGFFVRRRSVTVAAVHEPLDRLLIARHESFGQADMDVAVRAIEDMNWQLGGDLRTGTIRA